MGGWIPGQFAEKRLPTLAELDQALPDNPALLFVAFTGPAVTNTRGRAYLARMGSRSAIPDRSAPGPLPLLQLPPRHSRLRRRPKRGALDAMDYSARVGVTTNAEAASSPSREPGRQGLCLDGFASGDPFKMYEPLPDPAPRRTTDDAVAGVFPTWTRDRTFR